MLAAHTELGDTMIYFSVVLVVAAMLLGSTTTAQVYRIGDSGAKAVWGQDSAAAAP